MTDRIKIHLGGKVFHWDICNPSSMLFFPGVNVILYKFSEKVSQVFCYIVYIYLFISHFTVRRELVDN